MTDRSRFADVRDLPEGGLSVPELKWRELLFIGALREEKDGFVRDPSRPLPPFERQDLFPEGIVFEATRALGRIELRPKGKVGRAL
jgi:hypothetical protein